MVNKSERIVLGSGRLYEIEFTGVIPENAELEKPEHEMGEIQGGATLEYKPEFYTAEGDTGEHKKTIMTKETATLKTGIFTWNGRTLERLCSTARVTEDSNKRTVKIGGVGNQDGKRHLLHFVHKDAKDGDIRLSIVGTNTSGFSFAFAKDKETVIDAEFTAEPCDSEGTLVIYSEDIPGMQVVTEPGSEAGKTRISVTPEKAVGNRYKYKLGESVIIPHGGETLDGSWLDWDGAAELAASAGQQLALCEVNASNQCIRAAAAAVKINMEAADV